MIDAQFCLASLYRWQEIWAGKMFWGACSGWPGLPHLDASLSVPGKAGEPRQWPAPGVHPSMCAACSWLNSWEPGLWRPEALCLLQKLDSLCFAQISKKKNQALLVRLWHSMCCVTGCSRARWNPPAITHLPVKNRLRTLVMSPCSFVFYKEIFFCKSPAHHLREETPWL